jgi:hypothetical protein
VRVRVCRHGDNSTRMWGGGWVRRGVNFPCHYNRIIWKCSTTPPEVSGRGRTARKNKRTCLNVKLNIIYRYIYLYVSDICVYARVIVFMLAFCVCVLTFFFFFFDCVLRLRLLCALVHVEAFRWGGGEISPCHLGKQNCSIIPLSCVGGEHCDIYVLVCTRACVSIHILFMLLLICITSVRKYIGAMVVCT